MALSQDHGIYSDKSFTPKPDAVEMSIDINWDTITSGPDGEALAEKIRSFVHDKFQQVPLPRFIRSVQVHSFDFGKVCPELEIKDICDPLPDFYEDEEGDDGEGGEEEDAGLRGRTRTASVPGVTNEQNIQELQEALNAQDSAKTNASKRPPSIIPPAADPRLQALMSPFHHLASPLGSPFRSGTPGIPGGTSNMNYFHLPVGGISGSQTPLAAVAGGTPFLNNWHDNANREHYGSDAHSHRNGNTRRQSQETPSAISASRPSTGVTVPPQSPESLAPTESLGSSRGADLDGVNDLTALDSPPSPRTEERRTEDIQVICRVKYSGDVHMALTAEILLDYPMPSFVGIPLKLSITGLKFDGVAILAYIRKRAHFCFLSPEDAQALVGEEDIDGQDPNATAATDQASYYGMQPHRSLGGLLQEIEVESEIGNKETGKQVLKNVSKVEKFVLEQVRRIFEEEFVFPSFWTFLI